MGAVQSSARILSVTMAFSQGEGMNNHSANHTVGRSQMRHRALVTYPRGTDSSQKPDRYQSKENNTTRTCFPCRPRGAPFPANHLGLVSTKNLDPGQTPQ